MSYFGFNTNTTQTNDVETKEAKANSSEDKVEATMFGMATNAMSSASDSAQTMASDALKKAQEAYDKKMEELKKNSIMQIKDLTMQLEKANIAGSVTYTFGVTNCLPHGSFSITVSSGVTTSPDKN
jgi:hypothetical protein